MIHRKQQINMGSTTVYHNYTFPNSVIKENVSYLNKIRPWKEYIVLNGDNFIGKNENLISSSKEIFVNSADYDLRPRLVNDYVFTESPTNCYIIQKPVNGNIKTILMFQRYTSQGFAMDSKSINLDRTSPDLESQTFVSSISISDLADETFLPQSTDYEGTYTRTSGGTTIFKKTSNPFPRIERVDLSAILNLDGPCWVLYRDNYDLMDPRGLYINTDINLAVNGWSLYNLNDFNNITFISGANVQADLEPSYSPSPEGRLPNFIVFNPISQTTEYKIKKIVTDNASIAPGNGNIIPLRIRILFTDGRLFGGTAGIHGETDSINFSDAIGVRWDLLAPVVDDIIWDPITNNFQEINW